MSDNTSEDAVGSVVKALVLPRFPKGRTVDFFEIRSLLPHRGIQLLLDKVEVWSDRVVGLFEITAGICPGFPGVDEKYLIMRGTDIVDMAAQTLGIACSLIPELRRKRRFVLARTGVAKFHAPARAGQIIEIEIPIENITVKMEARGDNDQYVLRGRGFVARVSGDRKATISSILLISTQLAEEECQTAIERRRGR